MLAAAVFVALLGYSGGHDSWKVREAAEAYLSAFLPSAACRAGILADGDNPERVARLTRLYTRACYREVYSLLPDATPWWPDIDGTDWPRYYEEPPTVFGLSVWPPEFVRSYHLRPADAGPYWLYCDWRRGFRDAIVAYYFRTGRADVCEAAILRAFAGSVGSSYAEYHTPRGVILWLIHRNDPTLLKSWPTSPRRTNSGPRPRRNWWTPASGTTSGARSGTTPAAGR